MIRFKFALTDEENTTIEGTTSGIGGLELLFCRGEGFPEGCGYLYTDAAPEASLCVAAARGHGVFLGYQRKGRPDSRRLSLRDREALDRLVEVDGLDVSEGLFLPPELAWQAIRAFARDGGAGGEARWITPEEMPAEGNYLL